MNYYMYEMWDRSEIYVINLFFFFPLFFCYLNFNVNIKKLAWEMKQIIERNKEIKIKRFNIIFLSNPYQLL